MNTIVTAIAIILLIVFVELILFKKQQHKNDFFNFEAAVYKLVKEKGLLIYYKDILCRKLIGLDRKNNKLLLLDFNKRCRLQHCLSLNEIVCCNLVQLKDHSQTVKRAFLEIMYKDNHEPVRFCFYDAACDDTTEKTCLLLKARDWNQRINFHKKYWWLNADGYAV